MAYRPIDYILRGLRSQLYRTLESYRDEIYRRLEREYPTRHEARAYAEHERRRMEARVGEALRDVRSWVRDYVRGLIDDTLSEVGRRDDELREHVDESVRRVSEAIEDAIRGTKDWFDRRLEEFRRDFDRSRDAKVAAALFAFEKALLPTITGIGVRILEDFFTGLEQGAEEAYE